jgi:signal transduction histidine kinase/CheY-like chemotaxis protein
VGVWAGSLRLAELSRVGRAGADTSAHGFVTDRQGRVVAHQVAAHYVQYQTDLSAAAPVQAALRGQRGAGRVHNPIERVEELSAWVPLDDTGWAVVYQEPVRSAAAPIRALAWNIVPFAGGIATVLGVAGLLVALRIVRPIRQLTREAGRIGSGAPRFQVETTAGDEVGRLAAALNRMVAALGEKDAALRERAEALERAVLELESASRSKDEFLATLSHELRTPLHAVYGWARLLRSQALDADTTARALESIERNAAAQAQLIGDLLDISRIVSGKMRLAVESVSLHDVVRAAIDTVRLAADAKGVRLQAVLDPLAGPVMGDAERLQQVVWNLLVNAVKFTSKGGRVQAQLRRVDSHVELLVDDTGVGIAADVLPHVFERFRQADSSSTRTHGGLGIGLALVRHLVELHGGTVHAHSGGEGTGATFVVRLPIAPVSPLIADEGSERARGGATSPTPLGPALAGIQVLVVDDDPDGAELIATVLSHGGAAVRTCASAAEALAQFEKSRPDVLVSDIEMPGEDGYALIRRIRALPAARGGNVPAAAITGYGRTEDRVRALAAGFTTHVPKPVDPVELAAVVHSLARQGG